MRKVLSKFFLVLAFIVSFTCCFGNNTAFSASEIKSAVTASEDKYRYEKVLIGFEYWIIVYDADNRIVEVYPDGCGGGGDQ